MKHLPAIAASKPHTLGAHPIGQRQSGWAGKASPGCSWP